MMTPKCEGVSEITVLDVERNKNNTIISSIPSPNFSVAHDHEEYLEPFKKNIGGRDKEVTNSTLVKVLSERESPPCNVLESHQGTRNINLNDDGDTEDDSRDFKKKQVPMLESDSRAASKELKLFSAIMYAVMSVCIMMLTKSIFLQYKFNCFVFVAFLQYLSTTMFLLVRRYRGATNFPLKRWFSIIFVDIFPLPMIFMLNTISGLGATQMLNMPLFVMLRRLSILMTLFGEMFFLNYSHPLEIHISVMLMVIGAVVATSFDLNLPLKGVFLVLVNDVCTALNGVLTRWKLDGNKISTEGIMFYSNLFSAFFSGVLLLFNAFGCRDELLHYNGWTVSFLLMLVMNLLLGFGINYFTFLCMKLNSPLTVSVIGTGKNIVSSYLGMWFDDYTFSTPSFVGINLSVLGCIVYIRREFLRIMRG